MRMGLKAVALAAGMVLAAGSASAQSAIEGRVDRLEREMRAVQRKVFPGGNGQYFPPDITAPDSAEPLPGTPASSPVTDLTARVNAIEAQATTLTGQVEQLQHRVQLIEEGFAAYKRTTDARLRALEEAASSTAAPATTAAVPSGIGPVGGDRPAATRPAPAKPTNTPATAAVPVANDPARARLVAAVEKPVTDDPADDGYVYGYRLWQAKLYPEADAQLKAVVAKYPTHRRASWAQNLLGRSYLDQGKPNLASLAFYENYKKFHDGERAPDSLYYLAVALKQLGKPNKDICQVYDELTDVYATKITTDMKANVARGRAEAKCPAS